MIKFCHVCHIVIRRLLFIASGGGDNLLFKWIVESFFMTFPGGGSHVTGNGIRNWRQVTIPACSAFDQYFVVLTFSCLDGSLGSLKVNH